MSGRGSPGPRWKQGSRRPRRTGRACGRPGVPQPPKACPSTSSPSARTAPTPSTPSAPSGDPAAPHLYGVIVAVPDKPSPLAGSLLYQGVRAPDRDRSEGGNGRASPAARRPRGVRTLRPSPPRTARVCVGVPGRTVPDRLLRNGGLRRPRLRARHGQPQRRPGRAPGRDRDLRLPGAAGLRCPRPLRGRGFAPDPARLREQADAPVQPRNTADAAAPATPWPTAPSPFFAPLLAAATDWDRLHRGLRRFPRSGFRRYFRVGDRTALQPHTASDLHPQKSPSQVPTGPSHFQAPSPASQQPASPPPSPSPSAYSKHQQTALLVGTAAFLGTVADSLIGALSPRTSNELTNVLCTLVAALLALILV